MVSYSKCWDVFQKAVLPAALAITGFMSIREYLGYSRESSKYIGYVTPLCKKVMENFDTNKNGFLEVEEERELVRAAGYDKIIPTSEFTINLSPAENYKRRKVLLTIRSLSMKRGAGVLGNSSWHSSFSDYFEFPLSTLEGLSIYNPHFKPRPHTGRVDCLSEHENRIWKLLG